MNTSEVKAFFEQTDVYLKFNYNLQIRAETVADFLDGAKFESVLDMPCGTGDISAPFIGQFEHLTLMDFSANMVKTTRNRFDPSDHSKLSFVNDDFYNYDFKGKQYDLVMNIGILAHIQNPWEFINKTMNLVKPGGKLIIQNTDSDHWFAKLIHSYLSLRRLIGKDKYALNKVPESKLLETLSQGGFSLEKSFRYNQSFLGLSRLFSNKLKYKLTRKYFGRVGSNRHAKEGSDVTFLFKKSV